MRTKNRHTPISPTLQSTATDCGLACMVMVLQAHGTTVNLEGLRASVQASSQGVSVSQLLATANTFGLFARAVKVELDALSAMALPAILHWNFNHYVVLERLDGDTATILDPRKGRMAVPMAQLSKHFTGIAVEFKRLPTFKAVTQLVGVSISDLWTRLEGWRSSALLVAAISIVIQLGVVVAPLFMSVIVDQAIATHSVSLLQAILLATAGAHVLVIAGELIRRHLLLTLGTELIAQLNLNLVNHILRLPYGFFLQSRLNDVLSRIDSIRDVKGALTEGAIPFAIDGLFSIFILVSFMFLSPGLAAIMLVFFAVFALTRAWSYNKLHFMNELVQDRNSEERSQLMDTLRGIQTVKVLNAESARLSAWRGANLAALESVQMQQRYQALIRASNSALAALELVVMTGLAATLAIEGKISVGLLFSIVALRQQFRERAYPLIERVFEFKLLHARLQRLSSIVTTPKEYENDAGALPVLDIADLSIDIRDLHFRYAPQSAKLFNGLNLQVAPGRFVAIKGRSGLGKSTLIRILLGLVTPNAGRILIGGALLEGVTIGAFRNVAAAVMQDDQLFGGTLFDNISGFDPNASIEQIYEAARLACVHEEILAMPANYFGQVGDMGASLSGGQRQRILLARALYRKPRILFLDEGTANLDLACEARIIEHIRQLGITVICVAHRARALEVADEVYELCDGKLVREERPAPARGELMAAGQF